MISKLPNLRRRIILGLIIYTSVLTIAVGLHGFIVNENIEKLVWENVLNIDIENFNQPFIHDSTGSKSLHLYDEAQGDTIPEAFQGFAVGIHDEIKYNDRLYVIRVIQEQPHKQIIMLDITEIEQQEVKIVLSILLLTIIAIALMTWIGYKQLGKLINPLLVLANDLSRLAPIKGHLDIETRQMQYYESYILTDAIQTYIEKSNRFLESEKIFFSTTSHELRTPISVLSGAVEVLQDHPDVKPTLLPHLQRIAHVAKDMEELVTCLLFLARDQERLQGYAEQVDLSTLIPVMIENHMALCKGKQLQLVNQVQQPFTIETPPQLINIVISNLLRNAIENSDCGEIRIYQQGQQLIIEDPGDRKSVV